MSAPSTRRPERGQNADDELTRLTDQGFTVGGDRLKTKPRGYELDHPRIDLLRHRSLTIGRDYGFEPLIHTADLLDSVRADWRTSRALVDWLADRLGD